MSEVKPGAQHPWVIEQIDDLVVVDKPVGLPTTGRSLSDPECLQWRLEETMLSGRLWAVHQLDRNTSGLCLFTSTRGGVARWSESLRQGTKTYLAVCHGQPKTAVMDVFAPIGMRRLQTGRTIPALTKQGKAAHSTISVIHGGAEHSVVQVVIHTGRTHQVRLHMASIGCPLVGEPLHRSPSCKLLDRHALHAWRLKLPRPGEPPLNFEVRPPPDLTRLVAKLGLPLDGLT